MEEQVKSKQRVADHGEVLTGKREVNAMLDLVKQETERIDSRFLEPACGNGNFLTEILERKLRVVEERYGKSQLDYERYAILAVSSIYGIDILEDNVRQCRHRLYGVFDCDYYSRLFKNRARTKCREAVRFILDRNYGPINAVLAALGFEPVPWLWSESWAMWSIIAMDLWKSSAFFAVIFLAALQGVPKDLQEAATVDGAGRLAGLLHVTLPSLRSVTQAVLALSSIGAFRVFVPMFVLTQGGPAYSTRTLALHAYLTGFRDGELGYSSAISFALLTVILLATLLMKRAGRRSE